MLSFAFGLPVWQGGPPAHLSSRVDRCNSVARRLGGACKSRLVSPQHASARAPHAKARLCAANCERRQN
jgi:hypothetical protein